MTCSVKSSQDFASESRLGHLNLQAGVGFGVSWFFVSGVKFGLAAGGDEGNRFVPEFFMLCVIHE